MTAVRSSLSTVPPDQLGSVGIGSAGGRPWSSALSQRVTTWPSWMRTSAASIASRVLNNGPGSNSVTTGSWTTTSLISDATSGRDNATGRGVTMPTQCDESRGVRTGTGITMRRRSPAASA